MNEVLLGSLMTTIVSSIAVCGLTIRVLLRCASKKRAVEAFFSKQQWDEAILAEVRRSIIGLIEPTIGLSSKEFDLGAVISKVEGHEDCTNMEQLLSKVVSTAKFAKADLLEVSEIEQFVKSVYQFQVEAGLSADQSKKLLAPAIAILKGRKLYSKTIGHVELVEPKSRVDETLMWPINPGLRVQQPYGLIIRSENGEVLSRAKVRCS